MENSTQDTNVIPMAAFYSQASSREAGKHTKKYKAGPGPTCHPAWTHRFEWLWQKVELTGKARDFQSLKPFLREQVAAGIAGYSGGDIWDPAEPHLESAGITNSRWDPLRQEAGLPGFQPPLAFPPECDQACIGQHNGLTKANVITVGDSGACSSGPMPLRFWIRRKMEENHMPSFRGAAP